MSGAHVAAMIAASEQRIARQLREAGATAPERAIALETERRFDRGRLDRLVEKGVVRVAGPGAYWLDEPAWEALRSRRRTMILLLVGAALLAFAAITYFAQSH